MNVKRLIGAVFLLLTAVLTITACASQAETVMEAVEVTRIVTETVVEEGQTIEVTRVVSLEVEVGNYEGDEGSGDLPLAATAQPVVPQQRLIIKDGRITIITKETETAVNLANQLVVELGGYIINQRVYDDDQGYRYATMRLAIPVTQFENGMRALRRLGTVTDESASGEDVTDEFVDPPVWQILKQPVIACMIFWNRQKMLNRRWK